MNCASCLKINKRLKELDLTACNIEDQAGSCLIQAAHGLQELNLTENLLKQDSGIAILELLQKNTSFKHFFKKNVKL